MALDREAIISALAARIEAKVPEIGQLTRSVSEWTNRAASHSPVALLLTGDVSKDGDPPVYTLRPTLHVWFKASKTQDADMNVIEAAIDRASEMQSGEAVPHQWCTSLGGVCDACSVVGSGRALLAQYEGELRVDFDILTPTVEGA